jgi:hypothetical protein
LGFATPQRAWLRQDARGTIRSMMHEPGLKMSRVLSTRKVQDELGAFLADKPGSLTDIEAFRVLNLELWAQAFAVS